MVGDAIGQMLPLAIGVALSPMPIVAVVLMLVTSRARVNGPAFLFGWVAGIVVAGAIVLVVAGSVNASEHGQPADWVSWLKLGLGLLLLFVAARMWRARPRGDDASKPPKWMAALDGFSPAKAAGLGALLSGVQPKNLVLIVAGATTVAQAGITTGQQVAAWAIFTVIASVGVAAPVVLYFVMGDRAAAPLNDLKTWMNTNNAAIMAVLCLLIAAKLVGDAISGLTG